jgi:hypothetical protein
MTRESWLNKMVERLRPLFREAGYPLPAKVRVSCGWPTHRAVAASGKSRTLGQCFATEASAGEINEIFVSPCISDGKAAAAILCHELCHAADNCEHGHKAEFKRIALAIGLIGKMTATQAGPELTQRLNVFFADLGPYPHATLDFELGRKKQSTRMLKLTCHNCGYTVRTTAKWLEQGVPTCPCGEDMTPEESEE